MLAWKHLAALIFACACTAPRDGAALLAAAMPVLAMKGVSLPERSMTWWEDSSFLKMSGLIKFRCPDGTKCGSLHRIRHISVCVLSKLRDSSGSEHKLRKV